MRYDKADVEYLGDELIDIINNFDRFAEWY